MQHDGRICRQLQVWKLMFIFYRLEIGESSLVDEGQYANQLFAEHSREHKQPNILQDRTQNNIRTLCLLYVYTEK